MIGRGKIVVFGVFLVSLVFMMAFASAPEQNETIPTRNVTFIDGNSDEQIDSQTVEVGGNATAPEAPNHDDFTFLGWYDAAGNRITDFTNILSDMQVFARYSANANPNEIADPADPNNPLNPLNPGDPGYEEIPGEDTYWLELSWIPEEPGAMRYFPRRHENLGSITVSKEVLGNKKDALGEKTCYDEDFSFIITSFDLRNIEREVIKGSIKDCESITYDNLPYGVYTIKEVDENGNVNPYYEFKELKINNERLIVASDEDSLTFALTSRNKASEITVVNKAMEVEITKEANKDKAYAGDIIDYTINVSYTGKGVLKNAVITDYLGAGLIYQRGSLAVSIIAAKETDSIKDVHISDRYIDINRNRDGSHDITIRLNAITRILGRELKAGETLQITYSAKISEDTAQYTTVKNRAHITANNIFEDKETPDVEIPVDKLANLVVTKTSTHDDETEAIFKGEDKMIYYTVTVKNESDAEARNVVITDILTGHITYSKDVEPVITTESGLPIVSSVYTARNLKSMMIVIPALAKGEEITITYAVLVGAKAYQGEKVRNFVTVISENVKFDRNKHIKHTTNTIEDYSELTIVKEVDNLNENKNTFNVGDDISYTITVTNSDANIARNVVVEDTIPAGIIVDFNNIYVNGEKVTPDRNGHILVFSLGDLAKGEEVEIVINATIDTEYRWGNNKDKKVLDGDSIINNVIAYGDNTDETKDDEEVEITKNPILEISKTNKPTVRKRVGMNEIITYTITVSVPEDGIARDVVITDKLSEKVTFDKCATTNEYTCSYNETTRIITWNLGNVEGKEITLKFDVKVNSLAKDGDHIHNRANAKFNEIDKDKNVISHRTHSKRVTNIVTLAVIEFEKNADATVIRGDILTYEFVVTNKGTAAAHDLKITDNLPDELEYVRFYSDNEKVSCLEVDQEVICELGDIAGKTTIKVYVEVKVINDKTEDGDYLVVNGQIIHNTATLAYDDEEVDDDTETKVLAPNIVASKKSSPLNHEVINGEEFTYTIKVKNIGKAISDKITISDPLSNKVEYVSLTVKNPELGTCIPVTVDGETTIECEIDSLGIKKTKDYVFEVDITVKVNTDASGEIINTAYVADVKEPPTVIDEIVKPLINQSKTAVVETEGAISEHKDTYVDVDSIITYTITIDNIEGKGTAKDLFIKDSVLKEMNLELVPNSVKLNNKVINQGNEINQYEIEDNTIVWNIGDLEVGESVTVSFQVKVTAITNKTITNTAYYWGTNVDEEPTDTVTHKRIGYGSASVTKEVIYPYLRNDSESEVVGFTGMIANGLVGYDSGAPAKTDFTDSYGNPIGSLLMWSIGSKTYINYVPFIDESGNTITLDEGVYVYVHKQGNGNEGFCPANDEEWADITKVKKGIPENKLYLPHDNAVPANISANGTVTVCLKVVSQKLHITREDDYVAYTPLLKPNSIFTYKPDEILGKDEIRISYPSETFYVRLQGTDILGRQIGYTTPIVLPFICSTVTNECRATFEDIPYGDYTITEVMDASGKTINNDFNYYVRYTLGSIDSENPFSFKISNTNKTFNGLIKNKSKYIKPTNELDINEDKGWK